MGFRRWGASERRRLASGGLRYSGRPAISRLFLKIDRLAPEE